MLWFLIIAAITALDQTSKYLVTQYIPEGTSVAVIDGFFQFTNVRNTGIAFSIFQNGNYLMIPVMLIISGVLIYFLTKTDLKFASVAISFILGGAFGNLIDRIFRGRVTDFLDFQFGSYHFYIFNIADMFIVIGTALLLIYLLFIHKENGAKEEKDAEEAENGAKEEKGKEEKCEKST